MTRDEQLKLYRLYRTSRGEPWYTHPRSSESYNQPSTLAARIDRLERELKMGKYVDE